MFRTVHGRTFALLTAITAVALGGTAASATASPVTIGYTCELPYVSYQPVSATIDLDYPSSVAANTPVAGQTISASTEFGGDSTTFFEVVGAKTIEGSNRVGLAYAASASEFAETAVASFGATAIPSWPLSTVAPGSGSTATHTFSAGTVTVNAESLATVATLRDRLGRIIQIDEEAGAPDGNPNTITTVCVQDPGQSTLLDTFTAS